jgi:gas vesicle protein
MKFMVGLLLGFGLGVAVGLVMAPQSGEATRAQLAEQGITLSGSGGLSQFSNEIRARATEALNQGMEMYNRTKDELTNQYSKAKSGQL